MALVAMVRGGEGTICSLVVIFMSMCSRTQDIMIQEEHEHTIRIERTVVETTYKFKFKSVPLSPAHEMTRRPVEVRTASNTRTFAQGSQFSSTI